MADQLVLLHPTRDEPLPAGWLDWGDAPQGSSADRQFRVKNESLSTSVLSVILSVGVDGDPTPSIADDFLLSFDGTTFGALPVGLPGGLAAGETSDVLTLRRNTPVESALGAWDVTFEAVSTAFGILSVPMGLIVSTNFPVPHIWCLSPNSLEDYSESFLVVGQGFGDTQGLSKVWWARGTDQQQELEVIQWSAVPATYATASERRIDQDDLGQTNVAYQTIRTSVPRDQPFGIYDVFVETDDAAEVEAPDVFGGTATSSFDDSLDGGTASSTLTSSISGGGA